MTPGTVSFREFCFQVFRPFMSGPKPGGNVYSADASKIPTLSQCRERAKDGILKVEIKMKEGTVSEQSKGNGLKK